MKRIVSITIAAIVVSCAFVGLKYLAFDCVLPKANYGMRAICKTNGISDLYIGSSMFRQGIDSRGLDDNAFLLAYNSNKPCHEAMQLRYLLKKGASFKRLIVDMYPFSMVRGTDLSDVRMIMDGDIGFTLELYSSMEKPRSLATLYDMVFLQNNEFFATLPVSYHLLNARNDRGSNTSIIHGKTESELNTRSESEDNTDIQMRTVQLAGIDDIISICDINNIELLFLETPKYKSINSNKGYQQLMRSYAKYLSDRNIPMILYDKTMEIMTGIVNKSLVKTYSFDDGNALYYTDAYHISYEGRQEFTSVLKSVLL